VNKIVVSVSGNSYEECVTALGNAEYAELRTDLCTISNEDVHSLMSLCPHWIVAVRMESLQSATRLSFIESALTHHPDYIDFDVATITTGQGKQLLKHARTFGSTIIFSYHNESETPDSTELETLAKQMFNAGADIAKLVCMAHSFEDGHRMTLLYKKFTSVISFAMGEYGRQSRIDSLQNGLKIAYAAPDQGRETAKGQYRYNEMKRIAATESKVLHPFKMIGVLNANPSKSCAQRALAMAMLADGKTTISYCGDSEDVTAVKNMIIALGADIEKKDELSMITPASLSLKEEVTLNAGESGLALRMFASIVSLFSKPVSISGVGSLLSRPIRNICETLTAAGIKFQSDNGQLPLCVSGPITNSTISIDGSFSSQTISGLLITLPLLPHDSVIKIRNAVSRPYIDLTIDIAANFGVHIEHEQYQTFSITGNQKYRGIDYQTEGDWSGVANILVAAAISGEAMVNGLQRESKQADRVIVDVLKMFGADVEYRENGVFVRKNGCHPFNFDVTDCPDLVPCLAVLASAAQGTSVLDGVSRLAHKESDRVKSVTSMIHALGGKLTVSGDRMTICGTGKLSGGVVDGMNDHRIVMAASVAACICEKSVTVTDVMSVKKSFPDFFTIFQSLPTIQKSE